jgi:cytochrome c553
MRRIMRPKLAPLALLLLIFSSAVASQQPPAATPTPLPAPVPREPSWAFQVQKGQLPPEPPGPTTVPGSTRQYTPAQIDDVRNPPDWFPDEHPPAATRVVKGDGNLMACGACHLMNGEGHPESATVSGLTVDYFVQQMNDFRSGARKDFANRMDLIAKAMTDQEIREVAQYFAALKPRQFTTVREAATVPKTFVGQGRMRFVDPAGGTEPIGKRIITLPEDQERARRRDPHSGFIAYVPPGSVARGRALAQGGARTVACAICHGEGLRGLGNVPRISGLHPIYVARQLIHFKEGTRNGVDAALMKKTTAGLTDDDIIDLSAYVGSLARPLKAFVILDTRAR